MFNSILASRTQIPLMLAWAISIHKVLYSYFALPEEQSIAFTVGPCFGVNVVPRHDHPLLGGVAFWSI